MSALHAKLKLVGQTYLFCEKVSLIKNVETVLDLNKLNIAELLDITFNMVALSLMYLPMNLWIAQQNFVKK